MRSDELVKVLDLSLWSGTVSIDRRKTHVSTDNAASVDAMSVPSFGRDVIPRHLHPREVRCLIIFRVLCTLMTHQDEQFNPNHNPSHGDEG